MKQEKKQHYFLAYRRTPEGTQRPAQGGIASFLGTDAQARSKVLRLFDVFDGVSWWTWETGSHGGRLRQRL